MKTDTECLQKIAPLALPAAEALLPVASLSTMAPSFLQINLPDNSLRTATDHQDAFTQLHRPCSTPATALAFLQLSPVPEFTAL